MDDPGGRVADLYRGTGGRFWDRIEDERPATYPEENLALGRRREAAKLIEWLADPHGLEGLRVLDAGCGRGRLALRLARDGARVIAVDRVPRFAPPVLAAARRRELRLVVGDLRDLLPPRVAAAPLAPEPSSEGFDVLLLREVFQDYSIQELRTLFGALAAGGARRLVLTLRMETGWSPLLGKMWPSGLGHTVDPVAVLRSLQLETPYRLTRQSETRRRNFRSWAGELTRIG